MGLVLGITFPQQDINLGLEPSLLTVLPDGDNVVYVNTMEELHRLESNFDIDLYLCSVYITGLQEFFDFANKRQASKIVCGGYEPTINPEVFLPYCFKVITGPCDSFVDTINQDGKIVKGLTRYLRVPRYDLYDVHRSQQIIPDKQSLDVCTSINTSQGCPFKCDFCCSPLMCDHIMSKPLDLVSREIKYMKTAYSPNAKFIFIRD